MLNQNLPFDFLDPPASWKTRIPVATARLQHSSLPSPQLPNTASAEKLQGGLAAAGRVTVLFGSVFVQGLYGVTGICTGSGPSLVEVE